MPVPALRLIVPTLWLGLIVGLSFIEAPLKFLAPGITTPLGLGIGRLMFTALGIAGGILLLALVILAFAGPRENRTGWILIAGMAVILAVETLVIRPPLNARSDAIIAGENPGDSWLHYGYVAAEGVLVVLILWYIVRVARGIRAR